MITEPRTQNHSCVPSLREELRKASYSVVPEVGRTKRNLLQSEASPGLAKTSGGTTLCDGNTAQTRHLFTFDRDSMCLIGFTK